MIEAAAERLSERLAPFGPDAVLLAYLTAAAMLFKRSQEVLRHDERGSGWRRTFDPDRTPAWNLQWLSQLVGSPRLAGLTEAQQRVVVRDSPSLRRGTVPSLAAAGRVHLSDPENALVNVVERDGGAYKITVQTHPSQTPDAALVESALLAAKAAGLVLTYVVYAGLLVGIFEAEAIDGVAPEWSDVAAFEGDFTDVDDFETYT